MIWIKEHLNWTYVLGLIPLFIISAFATILLLKPQYKVFSEDMTVVAAIIIYSVCLVLYLMFSSWLVERKGRSFTWIMFTLIGCWWVLLLLDNRKGFF